MLAAMLMVAAISGWGCISPAAVNPPIVSMTPLGVAMRPAKPPDCAMPVLQTMPLADHQQIALVDAWGDLAAKDEDLLKYLKREGCQVGADAVVLTSEHTQHEGDLIVGVAPGRFGSIGPGSEASIAEGEHLAADTQGGGKKHHAEVGELGHAGQFMGGIAIIYTNSHSNAGTISDSNQ
ncbi:MAG: hypothetical protein ACREPW_00190 [Candidatus Binataceae bacterium]